jgi:hypothetical protein
MKKPVILGMVFVFISLSLGLLTINAHAENKGVVVIPLFETKTVVEKTVVEKTGQTTSYSTGDDGDLQRGMAWPIPSFTDNGDGTVADNLTGLIWMKNANCFGGKNWNAALTAYNALADGTCGLSDGSAAGDWRLPNIKELHSLVHYGVYAPALPNTAGTGKWAEGDLFTGVQSDNYWSSTTLARYTYRAWVVNFNNGYVYHHDKNNTYYVWCVRGGQ